MPWTGTDLGGLQCVYKLYLFDHGGGPILIHIARVCIFPLIVAQELNAQPRDFNPKYIRLFF